MKKDFLYADDGGAIGDGYSSDSSMDPNFVNEVTMQTDQSQLYNQTPADKLRLAASQGQLSTVKRLLLSGATFEPDQGGRTALHYAAVSGSAAIVGLLAAEGCSVNSQDNFGYTALHRAAAQGHVDAIRALLAEGCSIDIQDIVHGNGALHEAAWNGFSQTLDLMVKYKANVQLCNKAGFSALHLAAQNGHNQSARALLYANCNSNLKNNYGDTSLHTAARYGHAGVTRILLSAQCDIDIQNKNGDTVMHICSALKRRKIAKLVCNSGSNPTLKNKQNETAMDVAKRKKYDEIMAIILSQPKLSKKHRATLRKVKVKSSDDLPKKEKRGFFFFKKSKSAKEKEAIAAMLSDTASSHHTDNSDSCIKQVYKEPTLSSESQASTSQWARDVQQTHGHQMEQMPDPSASSCSQQGVKGLLSDYVDNGGTQYYRDLAGNIKQGPIGYQAVACNCGPNMNRLQQRIHVDRIDAEANVRDCHRQLSQRIDTLDKRCTQQVHALDRMTRDHLQEQRIAFDKRLQEQVRQERLRTNLDISAVKSDLQSWMDGQLVSSTNAIRDNRMTAYSSYRQHKQQNNRFPEQKSHQLTNENRQARFGFSYEREDVTVDPVRPSFASGGVYGIKGQGRIYRSKSDDTLSMSSVGAGNRLSRRLHQRCNEELADQHIRSLATGKRDQLEQLPERRHFLRRRDTMASGQRTTTSAAFSAAQQVAAASSSAQFPEARRFGSQRHISRPVDPVQQASFRVRIRPRSTFVDEPLATQMSRPTITKQHRSHNAQTLPLQSLPLNRPQPDQVLSDFSEDESEICVDQDQQWFKERRRRDEIMLDRALPELPNKVLHNESGSNPDSGYGLSSSALTGTHNIRAVNNEISKELLPISNCALGIDVGKATQV